MGYSKDNTRLVNAAIEKALFEADRGKVNSDYIEEKQPLIDEFVDEQTNLQTQLNDLVLQSGTDIAEVVQARGGFATVNDRLANTTAQLAETDTQVNNRIDNLIVNGGSDSSAEVIDGRQDSDGVVHPLIGQRIDSEVYIINQRTLQHSETTWLNLPSPSFISHRGVEASAPENTMSAFDLSAQQGFPIGMDLFETKDGVLVCRHDNDLSTRSDTVGLVTDSLYSSFYKASAGKWFSKNFENEKIPTFEQVLNEYGGKQLILAQVYGTQGDAVYARIANLVAEKKLETHVVFEVNNVTEMDKIHAVNPNILVCITSSQQSVATYDNAFMVNWSASTTTQTGINEAKAKGLKVQVYGVLSQQSSNAFIAMGVDFINASDPLYYKGGITFNTPFYLPIGKGNVGSYWRFAQSTGSPSVEDYYIGYMSTPAPSPYGKPFYGYTTKLNDKISFDLKFVDALNATVYTNIVIVPNSEDWNNSVSGTSNRNLFYLQIYASGRIIVYDVVGGVATKRADDAAAFTAYANGDNKAFSIKLNATSITITTPTKTIEVPLTVTHGHITPRYATNVLAGFRNIKVENVG